MSEERKTNIESLALSSDLADLFLGNLNVGEFQDYFEEPEYYYSQGWPDKPGYWKEYQDRKLVPLWEYSECIYCADMSCVPTEYLSFRIDSPDKPTYYGDSIHQMLFEIIDFHCFQIAGELDSALEFMAKISFPNIEGFKKLASLASSVSEFEVEYDKYINKLKKNA